MLGAGCREFVVKVFCAFRMWGHSIEDTLKHSSFSTSHHCIACSDEMVESFFVFSTGKGSELKCLEPGDEDIYNVFNSGSIDTHLWWQSILEFDIDKFRFELIGFDFRIFHLVLPVSTSSIYLC